MSTFFANNVLKKIQENESEVKEINNFLTEDECNNFIEYFNNLKEKSIGKSQYVEREESTKIFFKFDQSKELKNLKVKIEDQLGGFYVNDFQPHMLTSRYPLRLHVDTGKNPNDIIFKNVIIPVQIEYDLNKDNHKPPNTVIFKNRWYNQSALFTKFTDNDKDFIIKDKNGEFVDILNIDLFYKHIKNINNEIAEFEGSTFNINDNFKDYIKRLTQIKRYNLRTNKHIVNEIDFDKELYNKYLSHQPYEDCKSLEIDKVVETKIGSLIYWDRVRIHSSDNFMKNNVKSKTLLAFFTSKNRID
ncbi:hypothetical protein OAS95_00995 [Pelagibacteraceae bacterium]|nr:hypothetical protein [Pelagibacteraceae bacterium]